MSFQTLYPSAGTPGYVVSAFQGGWGITGSAVVKSLTTAPRTTETVNTSVACAETGTSGDEKGLLYCGVSAPLKAQTITGDFNVLLFLAESSAAANMFLRVHVWVTQGNSDTPRGTLVDKVLGTSEISDTWTGLAQGFAAAIAMSSLAIQDGDRLVIEVGFLATNTSATSYSLTMYYGACANGPDTTAGQAGWNSSRRSWFSFSNAIDDLPCTESVSHLVLDVATEPAACALRACHMVLDVATLVVVSVPVEVYHLVLDVASEPAVCSLDVAHVVLDVATLVEPWKGPEEGDDLTGELVPLVWAEMTLADGTTKVFSKVELNDPATYFGGPKDPQLLSAGSVKRALSDRMGNYEAAQFILIFSDCNRILRGALDSQTTKWLLNRFVAVRMISDEGRRLLKIPRTVAIGYIRDYGAISSLQFSITCEDYLALFVGLGENEKKLPTSVISVADFPNAAPEVQNLVVPIVYGELSDRAESTTYETPGVALAKPTGISASVTGGTAGVTRRYGITAMNSVYGGMKVQKWSDHRGETDPAYITVNNCPTDEDMQTDPANHHVVITIDHQVGQTGGRAYGRYPDSIKGLDGLDSPGAFGIVPAGKWQFWDGWRPYGQADWSRQHSSGDPPTTNNTIVDPATQLIDTGTGLVPVIYVGERELGDGYNPGVGWHEFLVCGHACKAILSWYQGGVRCADSTENVDWLIPGFAGWTAVLGAAKYRDFNGHRYTVVYGRGPNGDAAADGSNPLTLNVQGVEATGDGEGDLITDGFDQYLHLMRNYVLQTYTGGNWFTSGPLWPIGLGLSAVEVLDDASFAAAKALAATRFEGGYPGAFMIGAGGEQDAVRTWIQRLNIGLDAFSGFSQRSQYMVSMIDTRSSTLAAAKRFRQATEIWNGTFSTPEKVNDFENLMVYNYQRDYQNGLWKQPLIELSDADSITNSLQTKRSAALDLWIPKTLNQALDVLGRRLIRTKEPPRYVIFKTGLQALATELGDIIKVTHVQGIGATGWVDRAVFVMRHELDPDRLSITIEGIDVERLFTGRFILGDEALIAATWAAATTADREYGYLCDETTGQFSDGTPGKRLR